MNETITDLQARLAFQEDTIEQITRNLVSQQNEIYEMREMIKHLQKQLSAITPSEIEESFNETPPHY